jgi:hypothetical protein
VGHELVAAPTTIDRGTAVQSGPLFVGFDSINNDDQLKSLTGVSKPIFDFLIKHLEGYSPKAFGIENHLLICLMKMKLGLSNAALSTLFKIHRTTIARIVSTLLELFYKRTQSLIRWSTREEVDKNMPECFRIDYPKTRVIIDATEVKCESNKDLFSRTCMYSHYKSAFTCKFLIGVAPSGIITFRSKSYAGRTSDTFITNDSGILDLLEPGDIVMADKGFPKILTNTADNVVMVIPPRAKPRQKQFSVEQMEETKKIAKVRIHVERAIQRVKTFNILNNRLSTDQFKHIDQIFHLCCVLANFQPPLINEVNIASVNNCFN